jgi:hypothetical protein
VLLLPTSPATGINQIGTFTFNTGITTVTYIVRDAAGNEATCSFTVTVTDNEDPTISCPSDITQNVDAGVCNASVVVPNATIDDNCSATLLTWSMTGATVAASPATGINHIGTFTFNTGITTVTYIVRDAAGNEATCSFTVTVTDNEDPTISCPLDITQNVDAGVCNASVVVPNATIDDNCSATLLTWSMTGATIATSAVTGINQIGTFTFNTGITTVTYIVRDAAGNEATCSFTVTVTDNEDPTISCPLDITQNVDAGVCNASVVVPNATIDDNCGVTVLTWSMTGATVAASPATGINQIGTFTFNTGITTVTYIVRDAAGNEATCSFTVTVTDNEDPTISCPSDITQNVDAGVCNASVVVPNATIGDNCGVTVLTWSMTGATVAASPATGINHIGTFTFNTGITTVTYIVRDAAGNEATCSFTVTVTDNEDPTISCPSDITQNVDAGVCNASVVVPNATIGDNCGVTVLTWSMTGATVAASPATGINQIGTFTFNTGITTVTYIVRDAAGNEATCSFTVTVTDNIPPIITTQPSDTTGYVDASCNFIIPDYRSEFTVTDNCGTVNISQFPLGTTISGHGTSQTIVFNIDDGHGNVLIRSIVLTLRDTISPDFIVPESDTVCRALDCSYNIDPTVTGTPTGATDNCAVGITAFIYNDDFSNFGNCDTAGFVIRTWRLEDGNGNHKDKIQIIWVEPTARLTLLPSQDTICDGETTSIRILSPTESTLPVRFNYQVVVDDSDSLQVVTSGIGTGLLRNDLIEETFNNLSDRAQRAVITITPYTVTPSGAIRCTGTPSTIDIWVEPTARLTLLPSQDTICDGETTSIRILSPTESTLPVRFNYQVVVDDSDSLQVVTSGIGTGLLRNDLIEETFNNLSDRAQRAVITITPYTVTPSGAIRCTGTPSTIDIWVEPTARLTLLPSQDTICDGETTSIRILSPTESTLPVRFNYQVVVDDSDSLQVVTSGIGTGLLRNDLIEETFNNLSDRAQRAVITITPYTVTPSGAIRCTGTPSTIDIWVEPTARLTLLPSQDTICDGETTSIRILSPTESTLPVRFNYQVVVDDSDSLQVVTSGIGTGLLRNDLIEETFNNLSDRAQRAVITITPYTVTPSGAIRCTGTPSTIDIWVEPTARLTLLPSQDTICDGETTSIRILSPTESTLPVRFNYQVVVDDSDSLQVVTSGIGTGLLRNDLIEETFNNLSDRAQRAVITITPYTVTPSGAIRCTGTPSTIDIWVEPTARLTLLPSQDTICDGETTSIRILSPTESTLPVRFNYQVVVDDSDSLQVVTSGIGTGLLRNDLIEETFNNLSDRAQRAVITITPYTVTPSGAIRCTGTPSTIDIWVEPTARLTLLPSQDTICDGETTSIRILSPTESTLPVRFNYQVVVDDSDSLQVVTSGIGTGLLRNDLIEETFNNLSDRAQRAVITITPYTVTPSGAIRCTGTPSTIDIWVEPTARLTLLPSQDTICDGETTSIRILSPTESTLPVRFNYQVVVDDSDSLQVVTSGIGTGLLRNDLIEETFNNLSDRAQRAVITITPYTVTPSGAIRCTGTPSTIDIWVEPTARLTLLPSQDTICDGETTSIRILSPTESTLPVRFNYQVVVDDSDSLQVVTSGIGTGLLRNDLIEETFNNLSDRAQRAVITITPYTVTPSGAIRCTGTPSTIDIWVEPTARLTLLPSQDTICDGETTSIRILSPTESTLPVRFNYQVVVDDSDSLQVVTSGIGTGLLRNDLIEETFNNLSDRAQRAVITITPYTVTPSGAIRCTGTPSTIDIWVEPTARLTLLPSQDTICDGETTSIRILSPTESTLPVRFNYQVVVDDSDSLQVVTSGIGTGLLRNDLIEETFNNLSDRAQRAVITITPYTVTPSGAIRCTGTPSTIDIWVEPTARLTLLPSQDTICDGETTSIRILSPTESTLPVRFNYQVVVDDSDSLQVVTSGIGTGLLRNDLIEETFNNLSDRAQRAVITITPYTVTPSGAIRCTGTPSTIDIWVEPTARLTLLPSQDTICDGETTSIRILSPTESTLPVRFNYQVVVDDSDSLQVVTSGIGTGLLRNDLIEETFNNLSDRAQRAVITITPYTVTPSGAIRCTGTPSTIDIWVEPTARLTLLPSQDTICDGETTSIRILSPTESTLPVRFNYQVVVDDSDSLQVVTSGIGTGLLRNDLIEETFNNLSDRAQRAVITITPYTVTPSGAIRCTGTPSTIDIWVEPTARLTLLPSQDTICDGETTSIRILSPTESTLPVRFNYQVVVDDSDSLQVVTSGIGTGLLRNDLIEETFNNLSDRAQRAVITITPYTVTPSGAIRCTGTPSTIDIWVEPTARLTLLPSQDTICDGETTSIRILSPTESTLPVRFNYQVVVDDSDSLQVVTSGIGTGLLRNDLIEETFNNLSDRAQRAVITITPYTVTPSGSDTLHRHPEYNRHMG